MIWKVLAAALVLTGLQTSAIAGDTASGTWVMNNGKVTVKVSPCGANLCGTIVAMKKPLDKKGKPKLDKENPNRALRGRRVIGLTILGNMKPTGTNTWKGTIYNPDDGKTYASYMRMKSTTSMQVKGCVAGIFCKTMKFTRVK